MLLISLYFYLQYFLNTEDKNKEKLKAIKDKTKNIKEVTGFVKEPLSVEAKALIDKIRSIQKIMIAKNWILQAVTILHIILVIIKH